MDNKFVIVIGSRNNAKWVQMNLESVYSQDYKNFRVIYFNDASTDGTDEEVYPYLDANPNFLLVNSKERKYKTWFFTNLEKYNITDNDILVFLDGDDMLASENVLSYLNSIYSQTDCWMTYGGMQVWDGGDSVVEPYPQNSEIPDQIKNAKAYRKDTWRTSHLKTMRGFVWKKIDKRDLSYDGTFMVGPDDLAIMFAALELCPPKKVFRVTDPLYIYNHSDANENSRAFKDHKDTKIDYEGIVRRRTPYETLSFVTPTLAGGLGNQMFEIAAAASLAKDNNSVLLLDNTKHILPNQGRDVNNYISNVFSGIVLENNISPTSVYKREVCTYEKIPFSPNLQTNGHFQSWKYFDHNRKYIQKLFDLPKSIKNNIIGHEWDYPDYKRRTAIQVRRGDYHKFPDHHPLLPIKYFHETIESIDPDGIIWIFTDDKEWCEKNFKPNHRMHKYIDEEDYIEMYMMSFCKNLIISNSSFGWWAAYLNVREDKQIYVPDTWFGPAMINEGFNMDDLILPEWNRVKL
jgi:glycosyltransferase involved in cell wall biosynthesis